MRLIYSLLASATLLWASNAVAHADTVTNFTLTHGSDTIQFSISDSTPFKFGLYSPGTTEEFDYLVPLTVNGVLHSLVPGDAAFEGVESLQAPGIGAQFYVEYASGTIDGVLQYTAIFDQGIQIFTNVDDTAVFAPGTFIFPQVVTNDFTQLWRGNDYYSTNDKLVITQTNTSPSPVPESSTFALLGTGLIGVMGMIRRRFAR